MSTSASVVPSTSSYFLSVYSNRQYRTYAKLSLAAFLWLFGLFSVFLSPAPIKITAEMQQRHDEKLEVALEVDARRHIAYEEYLRAQMHTREAKVWFWRFKSADREEVRKRQIPEKEAYDHYIAVDAQYRSALHDAKSELGVWTEEGVKESRQLFWESYKSGKLYAQRQTVSDMLFSLIFDRDRDADALYRFMQFIAIACINFTTGMISALLIFLARLPGFILSFKPGLFSGVLFFFTCLIGSASVIGTFILLLYGSSLFLFWAIAENWLRGIEYRESRGQQQRINRRPHFD